LSRREGKPGWGKEPLKSPWERARNPWSGWESGWGHSREGNETGKVVGSTAAAAKVTARVVGIDRS
jgi:hypothetical protein